MVAHEVVSCYEEDAMRAVQLLMKLYVGMHSPERSNTPTSPNSPRSTKSTNLPPAILERVAHGERYKTELCRHFTATQNCKYGDKCQYAHGQSELRTIQRHPKYKTDKCRTFHKDGFCPYGSRCHFLHDESSSISSSQETILNCFNNISSRHVNKLVPFC